MIRFALVVASTLGFFLTAAIGNLMVPLLRALSRPHQEGQKEPVQPSPGWSPREHGVPTLGGLCFMTGTLAAVGMGWTVVCLLQPELLGDGSRMTIRLLLMLGGAFAFGAVGLADDLARLRPPQILGLRTGTRLALELAAAVGVVLALYTSECLPTGWAWPGLGYLELGAGAGPVWAALLVALAESARCLNGPDGVCSGAAFVAMLGLMSTMTLLGYFPLAVLPAALAGALMAFLLWNFPPARLLPGMTGCLFLAGGVGCVPLAIGRPALILALGLPFFAAGALELAQTLWRRLAHKALFPVWPLERWLERRGLRPETVFCLFCGLAVCGLVLAMQLAWLG